MNELLSQPHIQSGVVPFVVALVAALLLRPFGWRWSALALAAGFYVAAYLVAGLQFLPLTSTRKVLLLGLLATAIGLFADLHGRERQPVTLALFVLAGMAGLWIVWPVLGRSEGMALAVTAIGAFVYVGWLSAASDGVREDSLRSAGAAWILGLGTGFCAILGASALLGQLAVALGVAAGVYWLLAIVLRLEGGSLFALPAFFLAAALGLCGAVFAKVPWYSLLLLAGVPLAIRVPVPAHWPRLGKAIVQVLVALPLAIIAVLITWRVAGGIPA